MDGHLWPLYGACPYLPGSEDSSEGHGSRSTWHLTTGRPPSSSPSWKQASEGVEQGVLRGQPGGIGSGFTHTGHGGPSEAPLQPPRLQGGEASRLGSAVPSVRTLPFTCPRRRAAPPPLRCARGPTCDWKPPSSGPRGLSDWPALPSATPSPLPPQLGLLLSHLGCPPGSEHPPWSVAELRRLLISGCVHVSSWSSLRSLLCPLCKKGPGEGGGRRGLDPRARRQCAACDPCRPCRRSVLQSSWPT